MPFFSKTNLPPLATSFLILEDLSAIREIIIHDLKHIGFKGNFYLASTTDEAKELMSKHLIDFFILDWELPGTNGYTFLKELRHQNSIYRGIPVMMISAKDSPQNIDKALNAGAYDFMLKPWSINELKDRIKETWKKFQLTHYSPEKSLGPINL